jgi:hypothetical protein
LEIPTGDGAVGHKRSRSHSFAWMNSFRHARSKFKPKHGPQRDMGDWPIPRVRKNAVNELTWILYINEFIKEHYFSKLYSVNNKIYTVYK